MLYRLEPADYVRIRHLTDPMTHYLSAQAVVAGASPGQVWVDDLTCPTATLLYAPEGWHLFGHECRTSFAEAAGELLAGVFANGRSEGWRYACLHYHPAAWGPLVEPLLADFAPQAGAQHYLRYRGPQVDWRAMVPRDYWMVPVDAALLDSDVAGVDAIDGWGFGGRQQFLERGFGFCLLHDNRVVCACLSDCVVDGCAEVGISTHPDYRRRGFATATAAAAVEHCLARGITSIGWHCWTRNVASVRTAEKAGFVQVMDHSGLEFWLNGSPG